MALHQPFLLCFRYVPEVYFKRELGIKPPVGSAIVGQIEKIFSDRKVFSPTRFLENAFSRARKVFYSK